MKCLLIFFIILCIKSNAQTVVNDTMQTPLLYRSFPIASNSMCPIYQERNDTVQGWARYLYIPKIVVVEANELPAYLVQPRYKWVKARSITHQDAHDCGSYPAIRHKLIVSRGMPPKEGTYDFFPDSIIAKDDE